MEGSYSKVWSLCRSTTTNSSSSTLPLAEFSVFTSTLLSTVRSEIAACDEKAYETLPLVDAKTLLFFENEQQVKEFAKSVRAFEGSVDLV
jgi:26S proteasome regulatory subunit N12